MKPLLRLLPVLLLASCASVQSVTKGLVNDDLLGEPAPALEAGELVGAAPPAGISEADLRRPGTDSWLLLAFFLPT